MPDDFNGFDAALCDVAAAALLLDLWVAATGIVAPFVFAGAADFALVLVLVFVVIFTVDFPLAFALDFPPDFPLASRGGEVLEDFLRDFLDIRLPFVAFGGSIMELLRVLSGEPEIEPATVQVSTANVSTVKVSATKVSAVQV